MENHENKRIALSKADDYPITYIMIAYESVIDSHKYAIL
jgi:hypothetical protein